MADRSLSRRFAPVTPHPSTMVSSASQGRAAGEGGSSAYLTDGDRLFRVLTPLSWPPSETSAELEGCMTLAVERYSADDLLGMGLQLVSPRNPRSPVGPGDVPMRDEEEEW
jgi:hypothetical protein